MADHEPKGKKEKKPEDKDVSKSIGLLGGTVVEATGKLATYLGVKVWDADIMEAFGAGMQKHFGKTGLALFSGIAIVLNDIIQARFGNSLAGMVLMTFVSDLTDGLGEEYTRRGETLSGKAVADVKDRSMGNMRDILQKNLDFAKAMSMLLESERTAFIGKLTTFLSDPARAAKFEKGWRKHLVTPEVLHLLNRLNASEWEQTMRTMFGDVKENTPSTLWVQTKKTFEKLLEELKGVKEDGTPTASTIYLRKLNASIDGQLAYLDRF